MRALLDANLFISYLLAPNRDSPPNAILRHAFADAFSLLIAEPLLDELFRNVTTKPFLARRIGDTDLQELTDTLVSIAELVELGAAPIPHVCRDFADDYLLAVAIIGQADYLVSGDRNLLVLEPLGSLRIVSPAGFLTLLDQPS